MLHPNQFQVDEAWIVFKLNEAPVPTGRDGDFNFLALMDAASCFILSVTPVSAEAAEPPAMDVNKLLQDGEAHHRKLPKTLFIPQEQHANLLAAEAEDLGISVVRVAEAELLTFIGEAREGFRERIGGGRTQ